MKSKGVSIPKFEDGVLNEDAVWANPNFIAVSDGAGGGGVFAERWSHYLVYNLPNVPITTFEELDIWIDSIWEQFYNECETWATKQHDGLFLKKFYDEGSFATLAALWPGEDEMLWMTYGDSVVFHYNFKTHVLEHSFGELNDFNNPPYLINCKDPLQPEGFKSGSFICDEDSVYFAASDTLAHYILMMYLVTDIEQNESQLNAAIEAHSKNSMMIKTALLLNIIDFPKVIKKLMNCANNSSNFKRHIEYIKRKGLIGHDDYSIAVMYR